MGNSALKRIQKELKEFEENPPCGCKGGPDKEDDLYHWTITLLGPEDSNYKEEEFELSVEFPTDYPYKHPNVKFLTEIEHPHIDHGIILDLDIFNGKWTPSLTISKVMMRIADFLSYPNAINEEHEKNYKGHKRAKGDMPIYVNTLQGTKLEYHVSPNDTIEDLKYTIYDDMHVAINTIGLTSNGMTLKDDEIIPKEGTIHLLIKLKKPIIYLYPTKEMKVNIKLDINGKLTCIYPKFNNDNSWDVLALPSSQIIIDNKKYPYLFWEGEYGYEMNMDKGFIVTEENAQKFLEEKLELLGLNDDEKCGFITFWLPLLLNNRLSLCSFQFENYTNNVKLIINPKPDTVIRVFLAIKKIEKKIEIEEQKLEKIERKGFTVVEWGGCDLNII